MPQVIARPEVRSLSEDLPADYTGWVQGSSGLVHYVDKGVVYITVHNEDALRLCHEAMVAKNFQPWGF